MEAAPFKIPLVGKSQAFQAGNASVGTQLAATNQNGAQLMIHNTSSTDVVFMGKGNTAAEAQADATTSVLDNGTCGYPVGPGMKEMITVANDVPNAAPLFLCFRTIAAVTPVVYVTAGTGI